MTVDERSRHALYLKLEEVLGPEEATTLIEHLPPVGWADVATKRDLDGLAAQVATKLELEALKSELLQAIHSEIRSEIRSLMVFMSSLMVALAGVAFAAARLT